MDRVEYSRMFKEENLGWWYVVKRMYISTILSGLPYKKLSTILDVGCGTGKNIELLSSYGTVSAIDASPIAVSFCKKRGLSFVRIGNAENLPFGRNRFQLVTIFDVLYHRNITSDTRVLSEIYRVLKPKGYILLTDCAGKFLFGPHDIAQDARTRYSLPELTEKLQNEGFRIQKASYSFMFSFPLFILERLISKYIIKRDVHANSTLVWINRILITIGGLEARLLKYFSFPFGSSVIILAQKP